MKKITKYLIAIITIGVILGAGIPITYVYLFRSPTDPPDHNNTPVILNYYPLINASIYDTELQEFNVSAYDPDGDPLTYNWYLEGVKVGGNSTMYIFDATTNPVGNYTVNVNITDGDLVINYFWILMVLEHPPVSNGHVRIYVNSTIYSSLSTEISQYRQDVINQGYTVEMVNWSNNNVTVLRNDLINASIQTQGLEGAVLIGDLPSAIMQYYDIPWSKWRSYPIDLYLTDLDGEWVDLDIADGLFDVHNNGTGDIYPEIWVGRICPESLNNTNHTLAYQNYFARNHAYRTGQLNRPHSQLVYIDDDWATTQQLVDEWLGDMTAYNNLTSVSIPNSLTTAADYMNRLTQSYEFIHVFVHSWSYEHMFGPGGFGAEGKVNYTNILNLNTQALFYNLFACSAANFEHSNNLGTQYLFSNNTLTVVGSSKIGGMTMNSYFYTPLSQGKVFGEGMRLWYWNPLHGPSDNSSLGMTILGDPLLTILM